MCMSVDSAMAIVNPVAMNLGTQVPLGYVDFQRHLAQDIPITIWSL